MNVQLRKCLSCIRVYDVLIALGIIRFETSRRMATHSLSSNPHTYTNTCITDLIRSLVDMSGHRHQMLSVCQWALHDNPYSFKKRNIKWIGCPGCVWCPILIFCLSKKVLILKNKIKSEVYKICEITNGWNDVAFCSLISILFTIFDPRWYLCWA